jgi:hypothetical protein
MAGRMASLSPVMGRLGFLLMQGFTAAALIMAADTGP